MSEADGEGGAGRGGGGDAGRRGGRGATSASRPLRDQEPFATIRVFPRRFGWGIPLVFAGSIGVGLAFARWSLSLAIALQLFLQTVGLLWLYVPALRRRLREEAEAAGKGGVGGDEGAPTRG